ncbi:MAG: hypothetical protein ACXWPX_10905 [Pseudobdellovibrio sp.]
MSVLFFSCERKNDDTVKVSLQIPQRTRTLRADQNYLSKITDPLQINSSASVLATTSGYMDSNQNDTKNAFNARIPSLASNADVPINCYLVVASGPGDDANFSKNYCAKKK